jgi:hypothetical protein
MKLHVPLLFMVAASCAAAGQSPSGKVDKQAANAIARIEKALETVIDTKDFQDEMPLAKFLAALEARLPQDVKVAIRVDGKAFAKDLPLVLDSQVRLPPVPKRMTAGTALRLGLSQVVTSEADYDVGPAGIEITHPRAGAQTIVHAIGDVVKLLPQLLPTVIQTYRDPSVFHGVSKGDGNALLIRLLANDVPLKPWETIEVVNGTRLNVYAAPQTQRNIHEFLDSLRRLPDTAVIMNARLYEVDRTFFKKHVAPLFAGDVDDDWHANRNGLLRADAPSKKQPLVIPSRNRCSRSLSSKNSSWRAMMSRYCRVKRPAFSRSKRCFASMQVCRQRKINP